MLFLFFIFILNKRYFNILYLNFNVKKFIHYSLCWFSIEIGNLKRLINKSLESYLSYYYYHFQIFISNKFIFQFKLFKLFIIYMFISYKKYPIFLFNSKNNWVRLTILNTQLYTHVTFPPVSFKTSTSCWFIRTHSWRKKITRERI